MFKAQFTKERLDGYGVAIGAEFCNVKVKHPYIAKYFVPQPTLTLALRVWQWSFYMMIYKPANIKLNRAQRRANHMQ